MRKLQTRHKDEAKSTVWLSLVNWLGCSGPIFDDLFCSAVLHFGSQKVETSFQKEGKYVPRKIGWHQLVRS